MEENRVFGGKRNDVQSVTKRLEFTRTQSNKKKKKVTNNNKVRFRWNFRIVFTLRLFQKFVIG